MGWVPVVHWRVHPSARRHPGGQQDTKDDHPHAEDEVQPVVGGVDGNDVGHAALVDEQSVDSQEQVNHPATEQEKVSAAGGAGKRKAGDPEQRCTMLCCNQTLNSPTASPPAWLSTAP